MFTLIAIAATTSFLTLAIITVGITVLSIKDLMDAPESMNLRSAGLYKPTVAAVAPVAA